MQPLILHVHFLTDRLEWFKAMADQYKDGFIRTWVATTASVHIHKPEHVEVKPR